MYCIFIMYLVMLYQLWCLYHSYVGEATRARSFGTIMGHLVHYQITLHVSLGGLDLPSMVQHVAIAFLECCALIALTLIFHFQQDHLTLLDIMAHVKIGIYPFQVALWNTRAMLFEVIWSHVLPFESLVVQSYLQMQPSLIHQLYEQEFISLLAYVPSNVVQPHLRSYASPAARA